MEPEAFLKDYEIGGIGEIRHKTLRFAFYRTEVKDGIASLYAEYDREAPFVLFPGYPPGQTLLAELCNLHLELRELTLPERLPVVEQWCLAHVHPYYRYGDTARGAVRQSVPEDYWDFAVNVAELYSFSVGEFCGDLQRLYDDAMTVFALRYLAEGRPSEARRCWNRLLPRPKEDLVEAWQAREPTLRPLLLDRALEALPPVAMTLERDEATGALCLQPAVSSVFDAARFALYRFAAVNAGVLSDFGGKTSLAFCAACGRVFIKRGNRQKYCADPVCQSVRNQRKSREYYYREKEKSLRREIEELLE